VAGYLTAAPFATERQVASALQAAGVDPDGLTAARAALAPTRFLPLTGAYRALNDLRVAWREK
jgi:hypothetical protein